MLRASAVCEQAGFPSASLVCEGFLHQADAVRTGLGMDLPVACMPGHIAVQAAEELERNLLGMTLDQVIANLTHRSIASQVTGPQEPGERDIVCRGGFDEINRVFYEKGWSDGLPFVPPTRKKIEAFLKYTDRSPEESIATLLADNRAATIWSIAVNGVMAGCRPEYMPVLVAMVEALADPLYGVEHSGSTPGGETLIVLTGPIIKQLGFNFGQGVMRDGFMPNTSIGRFWRLYLRNVAGFRLHKNDMATYGNTWRVVIAENEDCLKKIGWPSQGVDMGFSSEQSTVTIANYTGGNIVATVSGDLHQQMLPYLTDAVIRQISWQLTFSVGSGQGQLRPLILLTPILAETMASAGMSKRDLRQYLFRHARIPASQFERILRDWAQIVSDCNLALKADLGLLPSVYHESDDPDRLVPLVWEPDDYTIVVTGDPLRNNAYVFAPSGLRGYAVTKAIRLPRDWEAKMASLERSQ